MNSLEQVKGLIKEEIQVAVLKAELATEEQIPNVVLESPKIKQMVTSLQIWQCNLHALRKSTSYDCRRTSCKLR